MKATLKDFNFIAALQKLREAGGQLPRHNVIVQIAYLAAITEFCDRDRTLSD